MNDLLGFFSHCVSVKERINIMAASHTMGSWIVVRIQFKFLLHTEKKTRVLDTEQNKFTELIGIIVQIILNLKIRCATKCRIVIIMEDETYILAVDFKC